MKICSTNHSLRYLALAGIMALGSSCLTTNAKPKDAPSPIGRWKQDAVGLPCFQYTGSVPASLQKPDGTRANMPDDPWFLLGNYRLTLFTHVSGEYELISGLREWGRMNQGERNNSGGNSSVLVIADEAYQLAGTTTDSTYIKGASKHFGCGFAQYTYTTPQVEVSRKLSARPSHSIDSGESAFLLTVTLHNKTKQPLTLKYKEDVRANYTSVQYQRSEHKPLQYTYDFSSDANRHLLKADIKSHSADPLAFAQPEQMSMLDGYPPSLFVQSLSGGTLWAEDGWIRSEATLTMKKGEVRTLQYVVGFATDGSPKVIEEMVGKLTVGDDARTLRSAFSDEWLRVIPQLAEEKDADLRREMRWHAYNLEAMATYSEFYREAKIPQGTIYDYYWGQHASARDNFQHALPLVYYNTALAKSTLRYMAKRTTPLGDIRLIEYGNGYADNMVYNTSDQQLFCFLLLSEYLRVTHDYAFLDEMVGYFPLGQTAEGTMLEHVERCFTYLRDNVGRGAHGLVRLLNSDWNDNVFVAKSAPYNNVIFSGESHMNTTMAISILATLIDQLKQYANKMASPQKVEPLIGSMSKYRSEVTDAFFRDHGDRTFSRRMYFDGEAIGDDNMFLEPQGYMLCIPELSVERKRTLYEEMKRRVYSDEKLGARQQQTPEFSAPGLEDGSRENGGVWYSLNGPVIVGVNTFDHAEAMRLLRRLTFANYQKQFPQYWTSYWSASDNIESSLMDASEGLPDQNWDYAAIPVFCAHPHAWLLYCYYRLNEK